MQGENNTKDWNEFGNETMTDEIAVNNNNVDIDENKTIDIDVDQVDNHDEQNADIAQKVAIKTLEENKIPWENLNNTCPGSAVETITEGKEQNYRMGWNDAMAYVLSNPSFFCKMNCGRSHSNGMERDRPYKTRGYKGNNFNPNYRRHNSRHHQNHHNNQYIPQQQNQGDDRTKSNTI